jgi:hypothetical protein
LVNLAAIAGWLIAQIDPHWRNRDPHAIVMGVASCALRLD